MTGIGLIIVFILAIALMIFCISKLKIHPFLAIMAISLVFGLIAGIPLVNTTDADGNTVSGIANVIGAGFSGFLSDKYGRRRSTGRRAKSSTRPRLLRLLAN